MNGRRGKIIWLLALSWPLAAALSGCTTRSEAAAQAHQAFLAGQSAALRQEQASQSPGVTVLGPVQNSQVPWVDGLTLAQAIATANYLNSREPKQIVLTRQGERTLFSPDLLLNGAPVPLQPGDVIEIRP